MKVLGTQLTEAQKATLRAAIQGQWKTTRYLQQRIEERGITLNQIKGCMNRGELIEFHNEKVTRRILLRAADGICTVLDLDEKTVVTAYFNNPADNHNTLRRNEYHWGKVEDRVLAGC